MSRRTFDFKKILFCVSIALSIATLGAIDKTQISYVLNKYQQMVCNRECLFYPAKEPKRLLIFFTGFKKNVYTMWSWFWKDKEDWSDTAYLFVKDDKGCWYLGNDEQSFVEDYAAIIQHFMVSCNLPKEKVFTIGGSMGGYAAIFYATLLRLKAAIAINPQATKANQILRTHFFADVSSRWRDLDQFVAQSDYVPNISLIYSYGLRDEANGNALIDALRQKGSLVIVRRHNSLQHSAGANVTKEFIEAEIDYFENQEKMKLAS